MTPLVFLILFGTAITVAVGDAFLKQAALTGSFMTALKTPWFYGAIILYIVQILLVLYLFLDRWKLGLLGNTFTVMYAILVIFIGYMFFEEKITLLQAGGIVLGVVGVIMMTYEL